MGIIKRIKDGDKHIIILLILGNKVEGGANV